MPAYVFRLPARTADRTVTVYAVAANSHLRASNGNLYTTGTDITLPAPTNTGTVSGDGTYSVTLPTGDYAAIVVSASNPNIWHTAPEELATPVDPEDLSVEALKAVFASAVMPQKFGAVGDGVHDDTAAIRSAFNSGATRVLIPVGTYKVTSTLTIPATLTRLVADEGAVFQAGSAMTVMLDTPAGTQMREIRVDGLTLDCNGLAATGFYPRYFLDITCRKVRVLNATGDFIIAGDPAAAGISAGFDLLDCQTDVPAGSGGTFPTVVPGSRGVFLNNVTDVHVMRMQVIGCDIGFDTTPTVGGVKFVQAHVYGHFGRRPSVAFRDLALGTDYSECLADSCATGWELRGYNTKIIGGGAYANTDIPDNTMTAVNIVTGGYHTLIGLYFQGADSTHRIARDIAGDVTTSYIVGWQWSNTAIQYSASTTPVIVGTSSLAATSQVAIRSAVGQSREVSFQTGTNPRWRVRADNSTESGSNAGTDLRITALDDTGTFLRDSITVSRKTGNITLNGQLQGLALGVTSKTASYTLTATDAVVLANGAGITLTLPAASSVGGRQFKLKNTGTSAVTVASAGGTIDGAATASLATQYAAATYISDGTNWYAI